MRPGDRISDDDKGPASFRAGPRTIIDFGGEELKWIAFDARTLRHLIDTLKGHLETLEKVS